MSTPPPPHLIISNTLAQQHLLSNAKLAGPMRTCETFKAKRTWKTPAAAQILMPANVMKKCTAVRSVANSKPRFFDKCLLMNMMPTDEQKLNAMYGADWKKLGACL